MSEKKHSKTAIKQMKEIMHEVATEAKKQSVRIDKKLKVQIKKEIALAFKRLKSA